MAERLRDAVEASGGPTAVSAKSGIPLRTLHGYLAGETEMKVTAALAIADATGRGVDWLIAGRIPVEAKTIGTDRGSSLLDPDLYGRVMEAVSSVYKECGFGASIRQMAEKSAEIASDLSGPDITTPEERAAAVRAAAAMLRRQLREASANPIGDAASKRQA